MIRCPHCLRPYCGEGPLWPAEGGEIIMWGWFTDRFSGWKQKMNDSWLQELSWKMMEMKSLPSRHNYNDVHSLHLPTPLGSSRLEILVHKIDTLMWGNTAGVSLDCKLRVTPGILGLLISRDQQVKRRITILAEVTNPDQQKNVELLLYKGGRRCVKPSSYILVPPILSYPILTMNLHV